MNLIKFHLPGLMLTWCSQSALATSSSCVVMSYFSHANHGLFFLSVRRYTGRRMKFLVIAILFQSLCVFADPQPINPTQCQGGNGFQDCAYVYGNHRIPVGFRLFQTSGKFDPQKPTIIYIPGGPIPISQRDQRTGLFPQDPRGI